MLEDKSNVQFEVGFEGQKQEAEITKFVFKNKD
jgi:hypothetical protein